MFFLTLTALGLKAQMVFSITELYLFAYRIPASLSEYVTESSNFLYIQTEYAATSALVRGYESYSIN